MTRTSPPAAVTFDFWNTLIRADDAGIRDRRLAAWLGLLAGEGYEVDEPAIVDAMAHAGRRFDDGWLNNRIYVAHDAVADMVAHLGIDVSPDLQAQLLATITDPDPAHAPQPTPGVGDALEALKLAGIPIGIICDVGLAPSRTLRRHLEGHGLLEYFDHVSFSDEVGVFKPDPTIFRHALAGLGGIDPADAAHLGDLRRTDIAGAQALGIYAIRYIGVYDDPGSAEAGTDAIEGDAVLADYAELTSVLRLA